MDLSGLVKHDSDQEFKENFFFQISSFLQRIHDDKIGISVFKLFVVDKSTMLTVSNRCKNIVLVYILFVVNPGFRMSNNTFTVIN